MTATRNSNLAWFGLVVLAAILFWSSFGGTSSYPGVKSVSVQEAKALIDAGAVVIDVRDSSVSGPSHVAGAHLIPIEVLSTKISEIATDKTKPMVVYCNDGNNRGPQGTEMLNKAGYSQAVNLKSGIEGWRAAHLPVAGSK